MAPSGKAINWHKTDIVGNLFDIFNGILNHAITDRATLDELFNNLEWHETEKVKGVEPIVIRFLEFCFFVSGSVNSPNIKDTIDVVRKLVEWYPQLKRLIDETAADAIGNIVLEARGRLNFRLNDAQELDKLLEIWKEMGFEAVKKEEVFLAIINKPTIQQKILQGNVKIKLLLHKFFPELAKAFPLLKIDPEEIEEYELFRELQKHRYTSEELANLEELIQRENSFSHFYIERNYRLAFLLKKKHNFQCQICKALSSLSGKENEAKQNESLNQNGQIEAHHVLPLEEGGEDVSSNIVILCSAHHQAIHSGEITIEEAEDKWICKFINGTELELDKN